MDEIQDPDTKPPNMGDEVIRYETEAQTLNDGGPKEHDGGRNGSTPVQQSAYHAADASTGWIAPNGDGKRQSKVQEQRLAHTTREQTFDGILRELRNEVTQTRNKRPLAQEHPAMPLLQRLRRSKAGPDQYLEVSEAGSTPNPMGSYAHGEGEFDSAYDLTPGFESRQDQAYHAKENAAKAGPSTHRPLNVFKQFAAPQPRNAFGTPAMSGQIDSADRSQSHDEGVDASPIATPDLSVSKPEIDRHIDPASLRRMKVWLRLRDVSGRTVVVLTGCMKVQEVFFAVQMKLARKLDGKPVQALRFTHIARETEEEPIDVELDDSDTWEALLALMPISEPDNTDEVEIQCLVET